MASPSSSSDEDVAACSKVRLPVIDTSQVHASRNDDALDVAVERLIHPYVDHTGSAKPLLSALHLASNATILPSGDLSGYVALVSGNARIGPLLAGDRLGNGTTWFRLAQVLRTRADCDALARIGSLRSPSLLPFIVSFFC